jgi:hypothetical protein
MIYANTTILGFNLSMTQFTVNNWLIGHGWGVIAGGHAPYLLTSQRSWRVRGDCVRELDGKLSNRDWVPKELQKRVITSFPRCAAHFDTYWIMGDETQILSREETNRRPAAEFPKDGYRLRINAAVTQPYKVQAGSIIEVEPFRLAHEEVVTVSAPMEFTEQ